LAAALAAFDRGEGGSADVLTALAGGRLLVPVAVVSADGAAGARDLAGEDEPDLAEDEPYLATVMTIGCDGRRGLLAFTCVDTLRQWDPQARPVPVSTRSVAEATLAEGADALVVDLAGPVMFSVDARELRSLAAGWRPLDPWHGVREAERAGRGVHEDHAVSSADWAAVLRDRLRATPRRARATGRRIRATVGRAWPRSRRS
jgi:hypothetical protein